MPAFLILLPLALTSLLIGTMIAASPQTREYVQYLAEATAAPASNQRLALQIGVHLIAYAALCFVAVATVHTVSAPVPPDRHPWLRRFQFLLELTFVALPSAMLAWLILNAISDGKLLVTLARGDWKSALAMRSGDWILWVALAASLIGLVATIIACTSSVRFELFRSHWKPLQLTATDAIAVACALFIVGVFCFLLTSFGLGSVEGAQLLGVFPVLLLTFATIFLVIAAIFNSGSQPVPVLSAIVTAVLLLQLVDIMLLPTREFRHARVALPEPAATQTAKAAAVSKKVEADAIIRHRGILGLETAFTQWIEHRRPVIEAYRNERRLFPLFIVAAQGGGFYAAYHSAMSLARMQDDCPEFAGHVFAISSVSGGSLGATVFSELVRSQPPPPLPQPRAPQPPATPDPAAGSPPPTTGTLPAPTPAAAPRRFCTGDRKSRTLEDRVRRFFNSDLLSPVVASALMFDIPGLLVPPLRWGRDRATALELSLEAAWRDLKIEGDRDGLSSNFYGRWSPQGTAPALLLSTTGVNYGMPVLVSQLNWQENTKSPPDFELSGPETGGLPTQLTARERIRRYIAENPGAAPAVEGLLARIREDGELAPGSGRLRIANLLDFRPDVQMAVSTAAVLSARFPYVTPPGNIRKNDAIALSPGLYKGIEVMELMDGGFYDNSGRLVATEVITKINEVLSKDPIKDLRPHISIQLIHFTHQPAKRTSSGSERGHFELISPIAAFETVRVERGAQLRASRETSYQYMYLFDGKFDAPLSWLLSETTKSDIELRSGGMRQEAAKEGICCSITTPFWVPPRTVHLDGALEDALSKAPRMRLERYVPNRSTYQKIYRWVDEGVPPQAPSAAPAPPPAAATPPLPK